MLNLVQDLILSCHCEAGAEGDSPLRLKLKAKIHLGWERSDEAISTILAQTRGLLRQYLAGVKSRLAVTWPYPRDPEPTLK